MGEAAAPGVEAPQSGSHVLCHSAASQMLRHGLPLEAIGAVLRHASIETTAGYAKVDVQLLTRWSSAGRGDPMLIAAIETRPCGAAGFRLKPADGTSAASPASPRRVARRMWSRNGHRLGDDRSLRGPAAQPAHGRARRALHARRDPARRWRTPPEHLFCRSASATDPLHLGRRAGRWYPSPTHVSRSPPGSRRPSAAG